MLIFFAAPILAADLRKGMNVPGRGDYKAAIRHWRPLAERGAAEAQYNLAQMYMAGHGVAKNAELAARWYTRAAEQAHMMSWYRLGRMHVEGRGVEADHVRAHMWLGLCAELGLGDAANWVAKLEETMTAEQLAADRKSTRLNSSH